MKKIICLITLLMCISIYAQFKIGAHFGFPTGNSSKVFSFNTGLDAAYTWKIGNCFDLGFTTGISYYSEKRNSTGRTYIMVPIAVTTSYNINEHFYIGADFGIALGGFDNGLYYQPKVGYYFDRSNSLYISYKGITGDSPLNALVDKDARIGLSSINVGYSYRFGR